MKIRIGGMDVGKHQDFTALTVFDIDSAQNVATVHYCYRWPRRTQYHRVETDMAKLNEQLGLDQLGVEINGPGSVLIERLKLGGLPVVSVTTVGKLTDIRKMRDLTRMSKPQMAKWILRAKQRHIIKYPRNSKNPHILELIKQNEQFKQHITEAGSEQFFAPGRAHDDLTLSAMIALHLGKRYLHLGRAAHVLGPVPNLERRPELEEMLAVA